MEAEASTFDVASQDAAPTVATEEPIVAEQFVVEAPSEATEEAELPAIDEVPDIPFEQMDVGQLQAVILAKMAKNGPVSDQMRRDVMENIWHDSLVNWAKSFH